MENEQCIKRQATHIMTFMTYFQLVMIVLLPFTIICTSYTLLIHRMKRTMRTRTSVLRNTVNWKMTRTVLVVVVIFIFCQTPYQANRINNLQIHNKMKHGESPSKYDFTVSTYLNAISIILVFISSCCNPIIYGVLNDNYSKYKSDMIHRSNMSFNRNDCEYQLYKCVWSVTCDYLLCMVSCDYQYYTMYNIILSISHPVTTHWTN